MESFTTEVGGRTLTIQAGKYAGQANAAVTVQYGETVVLATAVMSSEVREGMEYFPLMVDYEERLYAAGKIKGSRFIKREGRPSDEAILTGRIVDRSVRPLFDQSARNDVQVVITVLSVDQENDPDVLSVIAASTALAVSDIPWNGPLSAVRVSRLNDAWVVNPTYAQRAESQLDLLVCGTDEKVIMIESEGKQAPEDIALQGIEEALKHIAPSYKLIQEVTKKIGKEKSTFTTTEQDENPEEREAHEYTQNKVKEMVGERLKDILAITDPAKGKEAIKALEAEVEATLKADNKVSKDLRVMGIALIGKHLDEATVKLTLEEGKRVDGRALDEVRPLTVEVGLLPRTHGTGLFQRGETQVLSVVTLGSPGDEQTLDSMEESGTKRYMHHYNFPGFCVGEAKPLRGPGRRDIGHGALAEKALVPVLPSKEDFPYTVRVVSEVLSSNGSSSQASICGSTLALMDAGVPITAPVAGIAMGLVMDEETGKYRVLTDIQGIEDHSGMDFKVAGTAEGITAIQLDIKVSGLTLAICKEALEGAKKARLTILDTMAKVIKEPRKELSKYAPRISTIKVDPEKVREVIGRGGEVINKIIEDCGGKDVTKIDIDDEGLVVITSMDAAMAEKAKKIIESITKEVEVGEVYEGTVTRIVTDANSGGEIGAIVEIAPGKDGMVHISEVRPERIEKISDYLKVGDTVRVKVMEVDKERGRTGLSVRALTDPNYEEHKKERRSPRPGGNDRRGGGRPFRPRR
ncbi:MAG: polyribonucleotide nucleotidyltransferase [Patescibacteria group bacterium]|jgi:polyribonucleotide nucleotidyltransferase